MPRKDAPEFSYDEKTQLYRKRIKNHEGRWIPVYGKTKQELREKIKLREEEEKHLADLQNSPLVFQFTQKWYVGLPTSLSASRKSDYALAINKHICPHIGTMRLAEVTPEIIAKLMAAESHMSKSMQQKTVSTLKQIFAAAEAEGFITRTPCALAKAGGKAPDEKTALTNSQQETLLKAVHGIRAYPFCLIGLCTGMRREEILALKWDAVHIDCETPYVEVKRALRWEHNRPVISKDLKSKAARRDIPIPAQLSDYLKTVKDLSSSEFVICSTTGEPLSQAQFKNLWAFVKRRQSGYTTRIRKKNGIEGKVVIEKKMGKSCPKHNFTYQIDFHVTPHILRHTYITKLILAGTNIRIVQYLAGHAKIDTTLNIYTHLMENRPESNYSAVAAAFATEYNEKT